MNIEAALKARYPTAIVDSLLGAYSEIEGNFVLRKWKASELDAGHLVEAIRRIVENELFGVHTPIGTSLPNFSDAELKRYEQASGDESFRILIPRILKAVFNIRNKRGVGHLGTISPNEMDATYILYTAKWLLAELLRIATTGDPTSTQRAIESIVERRIGVLWKHEGIKRVLASGIKAREQVLILLFDESPLKESDLQAATEYKNTTNFRSILKRLHDDRLIEYDRGIKATITPKGVVSAEAVLKKHRPES